MFTHITTEICQHESAPKYHLVQRWPTTRYTPFLGLKASNHNLGHVYFEIGALWFQDMKSRTKICEMIASFIDINVNSTMMNSPNGWFLLISRWTSSNLRRELICRWTSSNNDEFLWCISIVFVSWMWVGVVWWVNGVLLLVQRGRVCVRREQRVGGN